MGIGEGKEVIKMIKKIILFTSIGLVGISSFILGVTLGFVHGYSAAYDDAM